jgi:hypothetical protein
VAIHIQPLRGWFVCSTNQIHWFHLWLFTKPTGLPVAIHKTHRFHLWLFIFNPFGVGSSFPQTKSTGGTCGYSQNPQVSPVAIISLRSERSFIFNPFGVGSSLPQPTATTKVIISRKHLLRFTLSRSARYCVSTPLGLVRFYNKIHRFH